MSSLTSPAVISCAQQCATPNAIRLLDNGARDTGPPALTPTELLTVKAIAYLQPATRAELSRLAGREISRDVIGALKRHGLIDGALHAPAPGAPYGYVTTKKFSGGVRARKLARSADIEKLEDAGLLQRPAAKSDLDDILGFGAGGADLEDLSESD